MRPYPSCMKANARPSAWRANCPPISCSSTKATAGPQRSLRHLPITGTIGISQRAAEQDLLTIAPLTRTAIGALTLAVFVFGIFPQPILRQLKDPAPLPAMSIHPAARCAPSESTGAFGKKRWQSGAGCGRARRWWSR